MGVPWGLEDMPEYALKGEATEVLIAVDSAAGVVLGVAVAKGGAFVAITMVLTCSVEVGTAMVGGKFSIVEDAASEDTMRVAVMV
jgi:uncharacterized membrane protein